MLGFNIEVKSLAEIEAKINYGYFDKDIKDYLFKVMRDGKIKCHPADLFDIDADVADLGRRVYLYNYDKTQTSMSYMEATLCKKFVDRVQEIYNSISEDEIKRKFSSLVNAKKLFMDVEKLGMPEVHFYDRNICLIASIEDIEMSKADIVLTTGGMKLTITHLLDTLKVNPGGRPANLLIDCKKCYDVLDEYLNHTGYYIYWSEK